MLITVAGNGTPMFCGDGQPALGACLSGPYSIALDSNKNVYISDDGNHRIRRIDAVTGIITTVGGNGYEGDNPGEGVPATQTSLWYPRRLTVDAANNIYFADAGYDRVRKIDAATGLLTTVAGGATATH